MSLEESSFSAGILPEIIWKKLSPSDQILRVMQRMISPAWKEGQLTKNLFFAEEIADRVPILHLFCTKNQSAVKVIREEIDRLEVLHEK